MRSAGKFLMFLGAVLIASALLLLVYNRTEADHAAEAAKAVLAQIQPLAAEKWETIDSNQTTDTEEDSALSENGAAASLAVNQAEQDDMPIVNIGSYGYIGYLSIPAIKLELPVMAEWDYTRLTISPCRHFGSTKTGDLVIAGHNFDRHFGRLRNLEYGDLMTFTDMNGKTTPYYVSEMITLEPTQMEELQSGDWDITLYTCTYGGKKRITVRFTKMSVEAAMSYALAGN